MRRRVIIDGGEIKVLPNKEELKVTDYGVIYLMQTAKNDGYIYKLHKFPKDEKYYWIGMWNTVVHLGYGNDTLKEALEEVLKKGYIVRQFSYKDLIYINDLSTEY